jgi:hypothetical protein
MIFLDMWKWGNVPEKDGTWEVLMMLDGMTGFAAGAFLGKPITAEVLADITFSQFFCIFGLPHLIVVDADSKFCGILTNTFENLCIHVEVVLREKHKAGSQRTVPQVSQPGPTNQLSIRTVNRCARELMSTRSTAVHCANRFTVRIDINTADTGSFFQWKQGVTFALYGWNAGPIDGTNIPRSIGAIRREFPFLLDTQTRQRIVNGFEGNNEDNYHDAIHPLIANQRKLLRILNKERRQWPSAPLRPEILS